MRISLVIFLAFFANVSFSQTKPLKHALIIAIGDYPIYSGWLNISSTNDVPYLTEALERQQFEKSNITTLIDSQATKSGIKSALNNLVEQVKEGDVVVIHVSSHGEQIQDDNGDETDGLDEAIVSYDAVAPSKSTNFERDTAAYFRDDLFNYYVQKLRKKLGSNGDLVVWLDACHSGSGTRGNTMKARGGEKPFISPGFKAPSAGKTNTEIFREYNLDEGSGMATYVVFSAARSDQRAFEVMNDDGKSMGSLSYALTSVMEQLETGTSYRSFFARIQSVINSRIPGQQPILEGNGVDRQLFGGNYVYQKSYVPVLKVKSTSLLELDAGLFAGLNTGAKAVLCKAGTVSPGPEDIVDTCTVISGNAYRCLVRTNKEHDKSAANLWAFIYDPVYRMEPIVLDIVKCGKKTAGFTDDEINNLKTQLADQPMIRFEGDPQLRLGRGKSEDSLFVATNGYLFSVIERNEKYQENFNGLIKQYAQYRFLQNLKLTDTQVVMQVELVPVINDIPDTSLILTKYNNGIRTYAENETFTIKATNRSNVPLYLNILDMQPDGWINPIFPNRDLGAYASDLIIAPGQTRIFSEFIISVAPPYGTEIYKVFVSPRKIDMENIVVQKPNSLSRGSLDFLESLVLTGKEATTRGTGLSVNTGGANGAVQDVIFEIVPEN